MIKTIRIQNFRSLQDVTLDLQDVNLLIGPNNSGKSNLLKAFVFLNDILSNRITNDEEQLKKHFFLQKISLEYSPSSLPITFFLKSNSAVYQIEIFGLNKRGEIVLRQFVGIICGGKESNLDTIDTEDIDALKKKFSRFSIQYRSYDFFKYSVIHRLNDESAKSDNIEISYSEELEKIKITSSGSYIKFLEQNLMFTEFHSLIDGLAKLKIYSTDISNLKIPYPTLEEDYSVKSDASNLVAFLDNMRDNQPQIMNAINSSLKDCIKEFESISFEKVKLPKEHDLRKIYGDKTFKRLGVQDKYGQTYWADELSDGTLYFLALLAIIHQPDPPKLLMVEEPENGIHPRRIKEIIDYFFTIAEEKGIQVILTTHSTVVIDQFKDLPESIFVFDKKDQSTQIRNLLTDIIAEDKQKSKELHVPELDLSGSLGDHWAAGLIGGVPR